MSANADAERKVWMVTGKCLVTTLHSVASAVAEALRQRSRLYPWTLELEISYSCRRNGASVLTRFVGTTSGFGKRLVSLILSRGDYVIATARDVSKFDVPLSETDRARVRVVQMALTDPPEKIQKAVAESLEAWGRIDVLINNAAWAPKSLLEEARCVVPGSYIQLRHTEHGDPSVAHPTRMLCSRRTYSAC